MFSGCNHEPGEAVNKINSDTLLPVIVTEPTPNDTDDPAIWINKKDPDKSLVLGTDKGDSTGGVYVFTLDGKIDHQKSVKNLKRPNNVDVEYGFMFGGKKPIS
ncbi:MAG: phytase, partial [Bacteroidales bacterium]|nr:phytase [Bacteroidales bacterium]